VREFDLEIAFTVPAIAAGRDRRPDRRLAQPRRRRSATSTSRRRSPPPANVAARQSKLLNGVFALESQFGSLASLVAGLTGSRQRSRIFSSSGTTCRQHLTQQQQPLSATAFSSG
jgi:hypothetical protein